MASTQPNGPDLQLTGQQKEAMQQIQHFLDTPGNGIFILKGYAGTGKTTLLQRLGLNLKKEKKSFVMLAPTGRAATVLRSKTGLSARTIHNELYHFSDVDGELPDNLDSPTIDQYGQMRLLFAMRAPDSETGRLYIVDEASMISNLPGDSTSFAHFGSGYLLSDLLKVAGRNKVIFAGDPAQLLPVGSNVSPALSEYWLKEQRRACSSFELTEILRQKQESGILRLATRVRALTLADYYPKWVKLPARDIPQVHLLNWNDQLESYIRQLTHPDRVEAIAVCFSQRECLEINTAVRQAIHGDPHAPLQEGDVLMVTQNNYLVPLANGDFVEVKSVGARQEHQGISFLNVTVEAQLSGSQHQILLCTETLSNGQANLTNEQHRLLMADFSIRMRRRKIRPKTDAYFLALQKDPYLNSLRANYGYAVTCHKSQGGEWDMVYLFLRKNMYVMKPPALTRWWYTGITRARKDLFLTSDWWIE
jgi:ATP-dependent exoDNAse (exonuclease V) alpha subunit